MNTTHQANCKTLFPLAFFYFVYLDFCLYRNLDL
jgi:hypothetical protein